MALLTSNWFGDIVTVFLVACGIFYLYAKYNLGYWKRRGVYSPPTDLIFGHFRDTFLMRSSPPGIMKRIYKDADDEAPFVGMYILHKPCLLVRSPELIKQILIKDFNSFADRHLGGEGQNDAVTTKNLLSINNPDWRYLRMKLSHVFTVGKLKNMFPLIIESAETMLNFYKRQFTDNTPLTTIEVKDASIKYTIDVISSLAFGIRTNSFQEPEPEFYYHGRKLSERSTWGFFELFIIFFFPKLMGPLNATIMGRSAGFFRNLFWDSMNSRERSGNKRGDVIDALVQLKNEEQRQDFKLEGDILFAQAALFFGAGFHTSSMTMAFTLLELAKHPEIQERARREVTEQFEKHGTTYEAMQEMKYLTQVVSETLRMYPPDAIIDRVAVHDYKIPGTNVVIEKGTPIYIILEGLQADPKYHPQPERYDPDRFSDERKSDLVPFTYIPFGDGPRICIGMRMGMTQITVGLAVLLREYEITLNPKYKNVLNPRAIFTAPEDGVRLDFRRISDK